MTNIRESHPLVKITNNVFTDLLGAQHSILMNSGVLLAVYLVLQILTALFLVMFYPEDKHRIILRGTSHH
ncbi:hypothetical protein Celaphus_00010212 [Cervus elaphus hippelaphus]|uniref:Uncharacterized protein n=1 Tax=Cervus elaphus hippelaphus TaxID=46360 RepID=A0A212C955_CEREH|nr:hypothetical protein Celaphus_00010212 [Cervus elaphus hippelaphus]